MPAPAQRSTDSDSPTYSYYGGGPLQAAPVSFDGGDVPTIRPPLNLDVSMGRNVPNIDVSTGRNPASASASGTDGGSHYPSAPNAATDRPVQTIPIDPLHEMTTLEDAIRDVGNEEVRTEAGPGYSAEELSDDIFDEIKRLGEGAGGAVHKVKDRRSGRIMARKTITTRETPPRQLLRELSFMRNTVHKNICPFYGAYISPSSSEVKVLMECCEGGSLEAVGRRIRELGGRISERVAGRLAEGVSRSMRHPINFTSF